MYKVVLFFAFISCVLAKCHNLFYLESSLYDTLRDPLEKATSTLICIEGTEVVFEEVINFGEKDTV